MKKTILALLATLLALFVTADLLGQTVGANQIKKKTDGGLVADSANALALGVKRGTTPPASPVSGLLWLDTSTDPAKLKSWNGSAWEIAPTAAATVQSGFGTLPSSPGNGEIVWASGLKRAIVYDSTAGKWYYLDQSGREAVPAYSLDGTYSSTFLDAPGATSGSVAASGSVTVGTHVCATTIYNSTGGETLPGTATSTLTASSGNQTLALTIPTGGAGAVGRRVYCSKANTASPLFHVTSVDDNSTTTYNVTVADASFGAATAPDVDFSAPLPSGWAYASQGRTYGGCGSTGTSLLCSTVASPGASNSATHFGVRLTYQTSAPETGFRARLRVIRAAPGFAGSTGKVDYAAVLMYAASLPSTANGGYARGLGPSVGNSNAVLPVGSAGNLSTLSRASGAAWAGAPPAVANTYKLSVNVPLYLETSSYFSGGTYYGRGAFSSNGTDWSPGATWALSDELKHVGIAQENGFPYVSSTFSAAVYEFDQFTVEYF